MHLINLAGASSVQDHDGTLHEAGSDGVFRTLPLEFARELVTKHASQWRELGAHEAAQQQAAVDELRNPHMLPGVVAELRGRVEELERRVGIGAVAESAAEKPAPARKTTQSKRTAAKKAAGKPAAGEPKDETPTEAHAAAEEEQAAEEAAASHE